MSGSVVLPELKAEASCGCRAEGSPGMGSAKGLILTRNLPMSADFRVRVSVVAFVKVREASRW